METKNGNQKMKIGSKVRMAWFSAAAGGILMGNETGIVVEMGAKFVTVQFENKLQKISKWQLLVV